MPRIPNDFSEAVAFLYPTRDDAEKNARLGGTCFLIGKPADGVLTSNGTQVYIYYAVSNRHVVWDAGASVIRFHRRDGGEAIFDFDCSEWIVHPGGDDLAAICLFDTMIDRAVSAVRFVETKFFLTEPAERAFAVGVGDEVFVIGRFLNYQGDKKRIVPAARFGTISTPPRPIWNEEIRHDQLSFAVEMRSRTGFSGSPVFVYRTQATNPFEVKGASEKFWGLLGVNWGYVLERDTRENTWLNGVVPAWRILELLDVPALKEKHERAVEWLKTWLEAQRNSPTELAVATANEAAGHE